MRVVRPRKRPGQLLGEKITATIQAKYFFLAAGHEGEGEVHKVLRSRLQLPGNPSATWDWFYGKGYWWFASDYAWYPRLA